jgi:hypothetical protein
MIVRGFEMEKGIDYVNNFSPTPVLAVLHQSSSWKSRGRQQEYRLLGLLAFL